MNLEEVEETKSRYEKVLLSIPGVEGVSIAELNGHLAIKLYVRPDFTPTESGIPEVLDGVPIVVEETLPFEAY